uniref:Uncharacterized protein n=1 Tax=Arundo donax TaxID=35708 RepID=A0A0A9HGQ3_ARUDO
MNVPNSFWLFCYCTRLILNKN